MLDTLVSTLSSRIEEDYRAHVLAAADGTELDLSDTIAALSHFQRTPTQFKCDVELVIRRRELASRLPELSDLEEQIAEAGEAVRKTGQALKEAKAKLDRAGQVKSSNASAENKLAWNAAKRKVADERVKYDDAFKTKTGLVNRQKILDEEISGELDRTVRPSHDATDPDAFKLTN